MRTNHPLHETDEQLVHAILGGDVERFGVLVQRHDALVRQCVCRCVSDRVLVEEAVQETWCRSFRSLHDLVHPQRLAAWLRRIATHCALEQMRKKVATLSLSQAPDVVAPAADAGSGWLWDLVATMPAEAAELLERHYRDGQSYAEIAQAMGLKHSTVRGRISCARIELRRKLESKSWQTE